MCNSVCIVQSLSFYKRIIPYFLIINFNACKTAYEILFVCSYTFLLDIIDIIILLDYIIILRLF